MFIVSSAVPPCGKIYPIGKRIWMRAKRVHVCNIILDRFPGIQSNHFTDRLPLSLDMPTYDARLWADGGDDEEDDEEDDEDDDGATLQGNVSLYDRHIK